MWDIHVFIWIHLLCIIGVTNSPTIPVFIIHISETMEPTHMLHSSIERYVYRDSGKICMHKWPRHHKVNQIVNKIRYVYDTSDLVKEGLLFAKGRTVRERGLEVINVLGP